MKKEKRICIYCTAEISVSDRCNICSFSLHVASIHNLNKDPIIIRALTDCYKYGYNKALESADCSIQKMKESLEQEHDKLGKKKI